MLGLGVVAGTEGTHDRVLASGLDMAKLPSIPALGRGGRGVGSFNHTVAAI